MAVEAHNLNLFLPQLVSNREIMNPIEGSWSFYNTQMGYGAGVPLSGTTTAETATLLPMYGCSAVADSVPPKLTSDPAMKSDSGLTYNLPVVSRKRHLIGNSMANPLDLSSQFQQQQFDMDRLVSDHMEKVRIEIGEKRKRQATGILKALEEGVAKRLRFKEEEIEKIGKLNWALEERVKSLCIETQIWRDLARTNEATAHALRANLEQVLAHQAGRQSCPDDDAESCCGSSGADEVKDADGWRSVAGGERNRRLCRNCRKEESCVLLLPCRHLCLCTVCGSTLHTCPVCKSSKTASVHVNMS